jgi:hypothetical protein
MLRGGGGLLMGSAAVLALFASRLRRTARVGVPGVLEDGPEDKLMSCLTLAVALGLTVGAQQPTAQQKPAQQQPPAAQQSTAQHPAATAREQTKSPMEGTWTVLCCEKGGQKMGSAQHGTVTIQGSVLTCKIDGKEHRVHLMVGPNHMLTAWPEAPQQGSNTQNKDGKVSNQQPATTAAEPTRNNPGQVTADARPNQQILPGQPGIGIGQPSALHQGSHHGVYIATNDFLCLALDRPFFEEEQKHAAGTAKPGEPAPTAQPKPGTQPAGQPGADPVAGKQQPANGVEQRGSNLPLPTGQAAAEFAERIRKAGYGPGIATNPQQPEHHGFVLILQREGDRQQRNK